MSATLQDIARKYNKPLDEVRRALPRVGFDTRNISAVAAIPQDIEQKLEALWLGDKEAAAAPPPESRPAKKRVIGGAEITSRKRRQINRPPRSLPPPPAPAPIPPPPPSVAKQAEPEPESKPEVEKPAAPAAEAVARPVDKTESIPVRPPPAPTTPVPAAKIVSDQPDQPKSEPEKLYDLQTRAARPAPAQPEPSPPPPPPVVSSKETEAPAAPVPAQPQAAGGAGGVGAETDSDLPELTPTQTSRPRPTPMEGDEDEGADFRRKHGRGIITIDERVVRRRRRKRERQVPRPRGEAAENIHGFQLPSHPVVQTVRIPETISLQNLADQLAMKAPALAAKLRELGASATDPLDRETAWLLVEELGHKAAATRERDPEKEILPDGDSGKDLRARPPVVTVMGHVDHGKTSLLDAFRKTKVAAGEAGGITQHIGAHQVKTEGGHWVTFIDTPGHELFSEMRARGARITDLVILVVAADDGVKPQTVEAISHAKAAGVPIVVAANKMDKADADLERVKRELSENGVLPEDWGGEAMVVPVSAETGAGLGNLLEAVALQSEVLELKSAVDVPASGAVIEGRIDKGRGAVASVVVRRGILRKGDAVLCGSESGKIRAMWDDSGRAVAEAGPSFPVEVQGLSGLPETGSELRALADGRKAREVAELRGERERAGRLAENLKPPEDILAALAALDSAKKELRVIVKADVSGSREALCSALSKIAGESGEVRVLHSGVGGVSESDAHLADSSEAVIVAFNVRPDARARKLMERRGIRLLSGRVIYDVVEATREALVGLLEPVTEERILGTAKVLQVFPIAKVGNVAGCRVEEGVLLAGAKARLLRDGKVVYRGEIASLRRFKDSAAEVRAGDECGVFLRRFNDAKSGDLVEAFEVVENAPEI